VRWNETERRMVFVVLDARSARGSARVSEKPRETHACSCPLCSQLIAAACQLRMMSAAAGRLLFVQATDLSAAIIMSAAK